MGIRTTIKRQKSTRRRPVDCVPEGRRAHPALRVPIAVARAAKAVPVAGFRAARGAAAYLTAGSFEVLQAAGWNLVFVATSTVIDSALKGAELSGLPGAGHGAVQALFSVATLEFALPANGLAQLTSGVASSDGYAFNLKQALGWSNAAYLESYLQGLVDVMLRQPYVEVAVAADRVELKNIPLHLGARNELLDCVTDILLANQLVDVGGAAKHFSAASFDTLSTRLRGIRKQSGASPLARIAYLARESAKQVAVLSCVIFARNRLPFHGWVQRLAGGGRAAGSAGDRLKLVLRKGGASLFVGVCSRRLCRLLPRGWRFGRRLVSAVAVSTLGAGKGGHRAYNGYANTDFR